MLKGRHIVLGVSGSIAAYKAPDIVSKLVQAGALVDVAMTEGATEFVTPLTFRSLTHRPVFLDLFHPESELGVEHVALAQRADVVVIAPATANVLAKIAHGLADDVVTTTVLATAAPVIVAPAMDGHMFKSAATQENLATLERRGVTVVGPAEGYLASGIVGRGRLVDTEELIGMIRAVLGRAGDFAGRGIVVTAGGTQEPIDPVRVLTNRSSGKMGYAVAEAARDRGADVTLITGPTALRDPAGVRTLKVETARKMGEAVAGALEDASILVMAAAVADFEPSQAVPSKIKKGNGGLSIDLVPTLDILDQSRGKGLLVGFAAESENLVANARAKLEKKGLDLIVANDITATDSGFSVDTNRVVILDKDGGEESLPLLLKSEVAHRILDRVVKLL
jgi:phosphopantothenoylcysteine decarboxylase/phosphopantothenate--cysteine ligase